MLKKTLVALALGGALMGAGQAMAADYAIDKQGQHAFVNFKISHLGYSWLYGTLNSTHKCNAHPCLYFVWCLPAQAFAWS